MPTVPKYDQRIKGPQQKVLPSVRMSPNASPDAFGASTARQMGQVGQAVGQAGQDYYEFQQKVQRKKNRAWVEKAQTKLTEKYNQEIYGGQDQPGILSLHGEDAISAVEKAPDSLDKHISEIAKEAPDETAAEAFKLKAQSIRRSLSSTISRHGANELNKMHVQNALGNAQAQQKALSADYRRNPEALEEDFKNLVAPSLQEAANLQGEDSRAIVRQEKESFYSNVINQLMAGGHKDIQLAQKRLDRWHDELTPEVRTKLKSALHRRELKVKADDMATDYLQKLRYGLSTETEIRDEINKMEDPDLKQAVRSSFSPRASQWRQDQAAQVQDKRWEAYERLDSLQGDLAEQYKFVNEMPDDTKTQRKAKQYAMTRYKQYASMQGRSFMTDPEEFDNLLQQIETAEITSERELMGHEKASKIANSDLKTLQGVLEKSQDTSTSSMRRAYVRSSGQDTVQSKKDLYDFYEFVEDNLRQTNRAGDLDYVQKLADQWFMEGGKPRGWFPGETKKQWREAIQDPEWMPQIVDDDEVRPDDQVALTRSRAQEVTKLPSFNLWMEEANGDREQAIRMYWKEYLRNEFDLAGEQ